MIIVFKLRYLLNFTFIINYNFYNAQKKGNKKIKKPIIIKFRRWRETKKESKDYNEKDWA